MEPESNYGNPMETLNDLDRKAIRSWLERALRDREQLPKATPDESPSVAILRGAKSLKRNVRDDIESACFALVCEFADTLRADEEYLSALLSLSWRLGVAEVADVLYELATDETRFSKLTPAQQQEVLLRLTDFKRALPVDCWRNLVQRDASLFGGAAFVGLLLHGVEPALDILPDLPENKALANLVASVLENYWEDVNPPERSQLVREAEAIQPACKPALKDSLQRWVARHASHTPVLAVGLALEHVHRSRERAPEFRSARLTGRETILS